MSTNSVDASVARNSNREIERNILRFAMGVMIPLFVMVAWQWEMAYITPTLVTVLIGPPAKPFPKKLYFNFALVMFVSLIIGLLLVRLIEPYPLVTIIIMGWILYGIFYKAAQGANLLITLLLLLSVLSYPSMAMLDIELGLETAFGVMLSYLLALFSAAIMYTLLPPKPISEPIAPTAQKQKLESEVAQTALLNTLIVMPILIFFLMFDHQAAMLTLVYVGILVPNSCLRKGIRSCIGILLANLIGGVVAIIIYELLVIVPVSTFYLLVMFLVGLLFAKKIFCTPQGALYASAFSCVLLLITDVTNTTGSNLDYAFYERWTYIALANLYVIVSFMILTALGWLKPSTTS